MTVTLPVFGKVAIADGELVLLDHNSGDERVHLMVVSRTYRGTTTSWDDHPGLRTELRTATFPISDEERTWIQSWKEQLWQLAPGGRRSYTKAPPDGTTPTYEWAMVLRRGDLVRVVEGGVTGGPDPAPDMMESVVDFLDMHF